jgi:hypothetical protein
MFAKNPKSKAFLIMAKFLQKRPVCSGNNQRQVCAPNPVLRKERLDQDADLDG